MTVIVIDEHRTNDSEFGQYTFSLFFVPFGARVPALGFCTITVENFLHTLLHCHRIGILFISF